MLQRVALLGSVIATIVVAQISLPPGLPTGVLSSVTVYGSILLNGTGWQAIEADTTEWANLRGAVSVDLTSDFGYPVGVTSLRATNDSLLCNYTILAANDTVARDLVEHAGYVSSANTSLPKTYALYHNVNPNATNFTIIGASASTSADGGVSAASGQLSSAAGAWLGAVSFAIVAAFVAMSM